MLTERPLYMVAQKMGRGPLWVKKMPDISQGNVATFFGCLVEIYRKFTADFHSESVLKTSEHLLKLLAEVSV